MRPRNGFAFCGEPKLLLLAGGIGITPLLPMAREAQRRGLDWHLVHAGRSEASMPFAEELRALAAMGVPPAGSRGRVTIRTEDAGGCADRRRTALPGPARQRRLLLRPGPHAGRRAGRL